MRGVPIDLVVAASVAVAACSSSSSPSSPVPPHERPGPSALIDVRRLTITWQDQPIARLHDDGRTESVGQRPPGSTMAPGPTLRPDGTILLMRGGLTARLDTSGEIFVVNPPGHEPREQRFATISGNRMVSDSGNGVRVEGATLMFENGAVIGTIEGTIDDRVRHTALVMTAAFFIELGITAQ